MTRDEWNQLTVDEQWQAYEEAAQVSDQYGLWIADWSNGQRFVWQPVAGGSRCVELAPEEVNAHRAGEY